jgi:ornithine carbamoyltransferase
VTKETTEVIPATGITLGTHSLTLTIAVDNTKESRNIPYSITPSNYNSPTPPVGVTATSSDIGVATAVAENGNVLIAAVSAGQSTVTVTTANGISEQILVNVIKLENEVVEPESIAFDLDSIRLVLPYSGTTSQDVGYTVTPSYFTGAEPTVESYLTSVVQATMNNDGTVRLVPTGVGTANVVIKTWNGLTDTYHPTQILAVFLTLKEQFGKLKGLKLIYAGDGRNNMANSLMIGSSKMGIDFTILAPKSLWPKQELISLCEEYAKVSGSKINISDSLDAVEGADAVYTDVWCSMGEEDLAAERIALLKPYQVNDELFARTGNEHTILLHCLPAVKGKEVTEELFERFADIIFDEAENRMHTIKAIMVATLGNN